MTIISLLLLASLLSHLTFTGETDQSTELINLLKIRTNSTLLLSAHVNVGIVNGREAKPHSRPYMVSIQISGQHDCGGFLISDQWVLTAAHCWNGNSKILDPVKSTEIQPYKRLFIINGCVFELQLYKKVRLNNNVGLISLPKDSKDVNVDTLCSVAGWGRLWTNGSLSDRLMEAYVTTLNHVHCQRKWGPSYTALQMICAYGGGGSCKGDSGGPLVCGKTAVGVTSFGDSDLCNSPEHPNVYTKISAYLPWIHHILRNVK
uniref:Mast cell protease 1A-like n=1 Tax=Sinocyclocheilus rhinocerous TaxID=307959 RepID=A0A673JM89_9TELE